MFCRVLSADVEGIDARKIYVESDVTGGLPAFHMVGLLSSEVRESRERVERAITNSGIDIPARRITINLSPASLRKNGTGFDIAIAVSVLVCIGIVKQEAVRGRMFVGELSLDGKINKVNGILPVCILAQKEGIRTLIVPKENAFEGAVFNDVEICGVEDLSELISCLNHDSFQITENVELEQILDQAYYTEAKDYLDIRGQEAAKRATVVAVAGFHNLLYIGPPGSGKSMMASRIPSILNRMSKEECLEVSRIYSVSGMLDRQSLILRRPFRNPHHSITQAALVGGMSNPKPGEITLAHKGVLFLDEAAEFKKDQLELLRQPLEDKKIVICRAFSKVVFPADFMLVLAANPCPCGYHPDRSRCKCKQSDIDRYMNKIRGPILDRIDICAGMSPVEPDDLHEVKETLSSQAMRDQVRHAQRIQQKRFEGSGIDFNSQMTRKEIEEFCQLNKNDENLLGQAFRKMKLSMRGYDKTLKVARTIADLESSEQICRRHLLEALRYRNNMLE